MPNKKLEAHQPGKETRYKGYWLTKFVDFFPVLGFLAIVLVFGIATKGKMFRWFNIKTIWKTLCHFCHIICIRLQLFNRKIQIIPIKQRAVCRYANNIFRLQQSGGLIITVKHVILRANKYPGIQFRAKLYKRQIVFLYGCNDHNLIHLLTALYAF